jgi:predicted nucleic acid-binding protein
MAVLIDSSSWIEALRQNGKTDVRKRVQDLLAAGQAAWCDPVRLELWNGARGVQEKKVLGQLDQTLRSLPVDDRVWELAVDLAQKARDNGLTTPALDLIIVACARHHGVTLEHNDQHLTALLAL